MSNSGSWTVLCTLNSEIEGNIIVGLLEQENIPVQKKYPGDNSFFNITFGKPNELQILVPSPYLSTAREIIQARQEFSGGEEMIKYDHHSENQDKSSLKIICLLIFLTLSFFYIILKNLFS